MHFCIKIKARLGRFIQIIVNFTTNKLENIYFFVIAIEKTTNRCSSNKEKMNIMLILIKEKESKN